ncbi:MAG: D-alanyl-D-alanine carboxypeptidase/D-alanyl-D-alanine-endopeptidase, partial [Solirubrobacteraceae bacterium]
RRRSRVGRGLAAALTLVAIAGLARASGATAGRRVDPQVARIMDKAQYRHGRWGLLASEPRSGVPLQSLNPGQAFVPGSATKLFSISAAWNTLGPRHRFTTPVYALGRRQASELDGNLVLVASGDLTLGGRTTRTGAVAFTNVDHGDANSVPGATLTPEDPLAGLSEIARQVRRSGITRVNGNVVIDDRLFAPDPVLTSEDPELDPIMINDNLIDVQVTPTQPGRAARVFWRPQTASNTLDGQVMTAPATRAATFPPRWSISTTSDGRIAVSGTIPRNAGRQLQTLTIADPAAFARTALIQALARAGVSVSAAVTGPDPEQLLAQTRTYPASTRVAAYVSPPYREYAKLILKVSHNLGAQLAICLMAGLRHTQDCETGFAVERTFLRRARVDLSQVAFADGRGGAPSDRATPTAVVALLSWWLSRPDFAAFRRSLPILGVDGSLAGVESRSPARGKVFAKTGTAVGGDSLNGRLVVEGKGLAGYLQARGHRFIPFALFLGDTFTPTIQGVERAGNDLGAIAAILQQRFAR